MTTMLIGEIAFRNGARRIGDVSHLIESRPDNVVGVRVLAHRTRLMRVRWEVPSIGSSSEGGISEQWDIRWESEVTDEERAQIVRMFPREKHWTTHVNLGF